MDLRSVFPKNPGLGSVAGGRVRHPATSTSAISRAEPSVTRLAAVLALRPSALFVDIDGTLSALVPDPADAVVVPRCRAALRRLTSQVNVLCVLTGRPADVAWRMIGIDQALYVGNHGLDRWWRGELLRPDGVESHLPRVARALEHLRLELANVPGILFEEKGIGFAIHFRAVPESAPVILDAVQRIAFRHDLPVHLGSHQVEVRVPVVGDKGTALQSIAETYGLKGIVVMGDDEVDGSAFRAAREHVAATEGSALIVTVGERMRGDADVALDRPLDACDLLAQLAAVLQTAEGVAQ